MKRGSLIYSRGGLSKKLKNLVELFLGDRIDFPSSPETLQRLRFRQISAPQAEF